MLKEIFNTKAIVWIILWLSIGWFGSLLYNTYPTDRNVAKFKSIYCTQDSIFTGTKYILQHDTLVVIKRFDTLPFPRNSDGSIPLIWSSGGYKLRKTDYFKNGITKDTIEDYEIFYTNEPDWNSQAVRDSMETILNKDGTWIQVN